MFTLTKKEFKELDKAIDTKNTAEIMSVVQKIKKKKNEYDSRYKSKRA